MVEQGYWLKRGEAAWRRVTMEDYIAAEQAAGFRPSQPGHLVATAGFRALDGTQGTTIDPHEPQQAPYHNPPGGAVDFTASSGLAQMLIELAYERKRQDEKFPDQHLPDGTGPSKGAWHLDGLNMGERARRARSTTDHHVEAGRLTWRDVLEEEYYEALAENDQSKLRAELLQVAAVAIRWIQDIDQRGVTRDS